MDFSKKKLLTILNLLLLLRYKKNWPEMILIKKQYIYQQ
jgi:hypothetical protein